MKDLLIIKKLGKFLNTLNIFKFLPKKRIPRSISTNEKIVRTIFSPINLTKDQKKIRPNAFKPPAGVDEISVNRFDFTSAEFCKKLGKTMQKVDKSFFGLGLLYAYEVYSSVCNIISSPLKENPFHADIKIGYAPQRGIPLPAEFSKKTKDLANKARLFEDRQPASDQWHGGIVE